MGLLDGRVTLITGTAGGQGRAAALRFAAEGAIVHGCDVNADGDAETARRVVETGGTMTVDDPVDLGDDTAVASLVAHVVQRHGGIDVLYNNASAPVFAPIEALSAEQWRQTVRGELDLVYSACHHAWPYLVERAGVIINTASASALLAVPGLPNAAHAATKGGVIAFTRQLAAEGGPHGVRANVISPGVVETPGTAGQLAQPGAREAAAGLSLLGRIGTPEDIAAAALWLASDESSSFVTGTNLVVDGGSRAGNGPRRAPRTSRRGSGPSPTAVRSPSP